MRVVEATVVAGKIVSAPLDFVADGTNVYIVMADRPSATPLAADELAELEAGIQEADSGHTLPGDDFLDSLKRFG